MSTNEAIGTKMNVMFINCPLINEISPTCKLVKQMVDFGHSVDYYILDNNQAINEDWLKIIKEKIEFAGANYIYVNIQDNLPEDYKQIYFELIGSEYSSYKRTFTDKIFGLFNAFGCASQRGAAKTKQEIIDFGKSTVLALKSKSISTDLEKFWKYERFGEWFQFTHFMDQAIHGSNILIEQAKDKNYNLVCGNYLQCGRNVASKLKCSYFQFQKQTKADPSKLQITSFDHLSAYHRWSETSYQKQVWYQFYEKLFEESCYKECEQYVKERWMLYDKKDSRYLQPSIMLEGNQNEYFRSVQQSERESWVKAARNWIWVNNDIEVVVKKIEEMVASENEWCCPILMREIE